MEVPPDNPNEYVRLKRFPPGFFETMVDWTTTQLRRLRRGALVAGNTKGASNHTPTNRKVQIGVVRQVLIGT